MVIMVLTSKNYFYLLNLTFAGVVFPTSMVSRFLAEDLAWATTTFLCPLPCVTTGVFTQGFTCTTALTFSMMQNRQHLQPHDEIPELGTCQKNLLSSVFSGAAEEGEELPMLLSEVQSELQVPDSSLLA